MAQGRHRLPPSAHGGTDGLRATTPGHGGSNWPGATAAGQRSDHRPLGTTGVPQSGPRDAVQGLGMELRSPVLGSSTDTTMEAGALDGVKDSLHSAEPFLGSSAQDFFLSPQEYLLWSWTSKETLLK